MIPPSYTPYSRYLALTLIVLVAGCASIMSGTSQDIQIRSSPSNAHVTIERSNKGAMETVWEGQTPATAKLKRKHAYLLSVSLDGYQTVEMGLESGTNGWVWGNLLLGGIIGLIVDYSNGAAKKLEPDEIDVQLVTAAASGPFGREHTLYAVVRILDANGHLRVAPIPLRPVPQDAR